MSDLLDALEYVGSAVGKPGRAVRGLLGGRPEELASIVPFSDTMGITNERNAVSGEDLVRGIGMDTGNPLVDGITGFGAEIATDPLTYLGVGLAGKLASGGAKVAGAADDVGRVGMKGLRDKFSMIVDEGRNGVRTLGPDVKPRVMHDALVKSRTQGDVLGAYSQKHNVGFVSPRAKDPGITRRHETMHGLIDQARKGGDSSSLGPMGRIAANLPSTIDEGSSGLMRALGLIADETAAHAAEGRGLLEQLQRGGRFFSKKRSAAYGPQVAEHSPLIAAIYQKAHLAPYAAGAAGATGGGIAAAEYL